MRAPDRGDEEHLCCQRVRPPKWPLCRFQFGSGTHPDLTHRSTQNTAELRRERRSARQFSVASGFSLVCAGRPAADHSSIAVDGASVVSPSALSAVRASPGRLPGAAPTHTGVALLRRAHPLPRPHGPRRRSPVDHQLIRSHLAVSLALPQGAGAPPHVAASVLSSISIDGSRPILETARISA